MKKFIISAVLTAAAFVSVSARAEDMRGVWVSSAYNLDYPSLPTTDAAELKRQADEIIDCCADTGFNAVFLQTRPMCDALYKSDIFPWSEYLTGERGAAPEDGFDPLEYWIERCHEKNMELHAWINPYRITKRGGLETLAENNPAKARPYLTVRDGEGLYFDPGLPEVRELVIQGAEEIARNYDVDGIHMDDYFYPSKGFADEGSYEKYGGGTARDDWRRSNTEALVREMGERLHKIKSGLSFGISPCGIWENSSRSPEGSKTSGISAYSDLYADTLKWAKEGIIDYIAPQIYWYNGYGAADYGELLAWWSGRLAGSGTKLYIGLADYRLEEFGDDAASPWYGGEEIIRQMRMNKENEAVEGEIHFRYGDLKNYPYLREKIRAEYVREARKVCLYIYYGADGRIMYIEKENGAFDADRARARAPEGARSVKWVCAASGEKHTENL